MMFNSDAASTILRVMRFVPRKEQSEFLKAMLAHTTAYLCVLEGDHVAVETLYRLGDAIGLPEIQKVSMAVRGRLR